MHDFSVNVKTQLIEKKLDTCMNIFRVSYTKFKDDRIGSKTTDECGDEWRRVHTTGDEYIRVGIVQEKST